MSKSKRHRRSGKSQRHDGSVTEHGHADTDGSPAEQPGKGTPTETSRTTSRPSGQRLFDMPYSAQVPSPVNREIGLAALVARAGHNAAYDIDVTLLDAADHRLIRTGVLLAHRVLDGRGEWYLGGPDWVPLLPKELILPMGQAELPDDLAELIRPFRRGAPLSPVAALRCERREFALRNADKVTVALLRDDKVTVRRNGLITARYREVMMTPIGPGLDAAQSNWLRECLTSAGATELDRFPRLVRRLGAPATGPSDLPVPADPTGGTFGQFLTQLLGGSARELISADLALTGDIPGAEKRLKDAIGVLRSQLLGLRDVLGGDWVAEAVEDLDWLTAPDDPVPAGSTVGGWRSGGSGLGGSDWSSSALGGSASGDAEPSWLGTPAPSDDLAALGGPGAVVGAVDAHRAPTGCRSRLRNPRYLNLLERLIAAARAPRVGAAAAVPAADGVSTLHDAARTRFLRAADRLSVGGPPQTWATARSAGRDLTRVAVIRAMIAPEETAKEGDRLAPALTLLEEAVKVDEDTAAATAGIDALTPVEAFEAGRRFERDQERSSDVRSTFVSSWPKLRRKLG
ncbi:MAG: hypothetical protein QM650_08190 [Microlunatus sp.]